MAVEGDEIRIAGGTYSDLHVLPRDDLTTTGVVTQVVYLSKTLSLTGGYSTTDHFATSNPAVNPTTLDASGQGRVIYVTGGISPTITALRVTGGRYAMQLFWLFGTPVGEGAGGGIFAYKSSLALSNSLVFNNSAEDGGGIFIVGGSGTLIRNGIYGNSAQGSHYGYGGGIRICDSSAILADNVIRQNSATRGSGIAGGSSGLYDFGCLPNHSLILSRNMIVDNLSGAYFGNDSSLWENNIISGNQLDVGLDGAIVLTLANADFINNVIMDNNGGLNISGSDVKLFHNTFARNNGAAIQVSGAIVGFQHYASVSSHVAISNSIVVSSGSGMYVDSVIQDPTHPFYVKVNGVLWFGNTYNYLTTFNPQVGPAITTSHEYTGNPFFAADGYHLARSDSAAVHHGVDAGIATDIDGQSRPIGKAPDLGADEFEPTPISGVTLSSPSVGFVNVPYIATARVTPVYATQPITYTWQASSQAPAIHSNRSETDSALFTWSLTGTEFFTVTVFNGLSSPVTVTTTVSIRAPNSRSYLPLISR
jgi:hypothetical protein